MKKPIFKEAALNWEFSQEDLANFSRDVWPLVDAVPGFLSQLDAFFLYQTARTLKGTSRGVDHPQAAAVVEIGSHKGRSAVAIGLGLKANPHLKLRLVCIEPFFDSQRDKNLKAEFLSSISRAGLQNDVVCMAEYSENAVKKWNPAEGIAMLWIDGNHEFEFVRDDFLCWSRYLVPGGIVIFHDWYLLGVKKAVDEYIFSEKGYVDIAAVDYSLISARKVDRTPSWGERAKKKRIYWAFKTGSLNPFVAVLGMLYEWMNRPFGSLTHFFTIKLTVSGKKS
jgi:predicted O-methyltransferase YrrM